jgi:uroporphyrinogen-III decarboxylase
MINDRILACPAAAGGESREFLKTLWQCENETRPGFLIGYTGPRLRGGKPIVSALFSVEGTDTVRTRLQDPEKFLRAQLEEIQGQLAFRGDFVPALTPTVGVVTIPSAFGCEVVWHERDFPSVRSLIKDPDEIPDLKMPGLRDGELGRVLDYTRYFRQQTHAQYPIRLTDIQGPLDNGSLIMGHNNFLLAINTHPELVHRLLQMITDLTIAFVREQRKAAEDFVPSLMQPWMPDGWGISISNDDSVMISSRHMEEFGVPYFNQLSDAFGGLYVHSCGNWLHQIPALDKIRNLRGLEFGASETPFAPVQEHFGGKVVLACRVGLNKDYKFNSMADYVREIMSARATNRGLFIHVDVTNGIVDDSWPVTDLDELYSLILGE